VQRITSRQNAIVGRYRDAARGGADQPILLDGTHLVRDALAAHVPLQHLIVASDVVETPEVADLLSTAAARDVDIAAASSSVMDIASPVRSSSPVVALATRPGPTLAPYAGVSPLVVVVCDVQDPGNVGAIVRVAEAAGASAVVIAGMSADPFGWKALRGSMGSVLRMSIAIVSTIDAAVRDARNHHARIVATVPRDGAPLFESTLQGPTALLIGGEGAGLPPDVVRNADATISIPMKSPVESLNAAVATAVLLYEARRQRLAVEDTQARPAVSTRG
jgi:TrmH family RNA methyltransferase